MNIMEWGKLTRVIRELDGEDLSGYSEDKVLAETIYNYDPNGKSYRGDFLLKGI